MAAGTVVDAHSDLLMELAFAEREEAESNPLRTRWLEQLERGGVGLQVCAIYVESPPFEDDMLRDALRLARAFRAAVEANEDRVFAVRDGNDLDQVGSGRVGLMLALEGADCLGEAGWLLDVLAALGVRMASLTHNPSNAFAGGCDGDDGLSPLGERLVDRIIELGIVLDLAHASEQTFWDALDRASTTPPVVSHAACRALHDHPRNVTDDQLRALAERDGVIGLMPHPLVLGPEREGVAGFLDHLDHAVAACGIDHVGLGGDFLRQIARALSLPQIGPNMPADTAISGLGGPADYPNLAVALEQRGYRDRDLAALLGGNFLRVLRKGLERSL
jgi:membrane dipeptidase